MTGTANGASGQRLFAGLRVIELGDDPAVELTGKLLAEMGAEVVKVEPPQGAASRRLGPFAGHGPDPERSLHFWYYNTSKRGLRLDTEWPAGRALLGRLLADADVAIHALLPAEAAGRRLDAASLRAANPRLIVCAVTPFGQDG